MVTELKTSIVIQAKPDVIWSNPLHFEAYHQWNSFIVSIKGEPKVGENIEVLITPPQGKSMTFAPKILQNKVNTELRWLGKFWVKGLFDGEHYFKIESLPNGSSLFIQGERFSGLLVPFFKKLILKNTKAGFEMMNQQIKTICESES